MTSPSPAGGMSFTTSIKHLILTRLLWRMNVTTYTSLQRAYAESGELARAAAERDHAVQTMNRITAERDELARQASRGSAMGEATLAELLRSLAERDEAARRAAQESAASDSALRHQLVHRDASILTLEQTVRERDASIQTLEQIVQERDASIPILQQVVRERDASILTLEQAVRERDASILTLEQTVQERDASILTLEQAVRERDSLIVEQRSFLADRSDLTADLAELRARQTQVAAATEQVRSSLTRLGSAIGDRQAVAGDPTAVVAAVSHKLLDYSGLRAARELLETYFAGTSDPNLEALQAIYAQALRDGIPYWDIRTALRVLAGVLKPSTYLEVGTRRGWSLAQVFAESPAVRAYVFELWAEGYGEAQQGDPDSVRGAIQAVVGPHHQPSIRFVNGNSHDTLPAFLAGEPTAGAEPPPQEFDLIAVDGDHSREGAWWDLCDLMPRVKRGGALVFDDLDYAGDEELGAQARSEYSRLPMPQHLHSLTDVWDYVKTRYPDFLFLDAPRLRYRAGIALRLA